ncbi:hypothetical protein DIJ64_00550 [Mycobacterium leprae]|uniref:Uncharacterized protein n=1 Tax=Mycobacterium leprae TaxID=1769 RepID=A0AAD0P4B0_MYCLR|nr:hypothetical protein DIJ64_00550 [Mycobacterium leprae]OAR20994.1 hypothetical protein A8144_08175 [Mycobacterium leprae 3125609]OAX71141.1 hypothetical protein A3216_07550 [Mycobacterium leprae 7935681]
MLTRLEIAELLDEDSECAIARSVGDNLVLDGGNSRLCRELSLLDLVLANGGRSKRRCPKEINS